jgi:hypothetical protein
MVRDARNGLAFASSPTPSPKALLIPSEAESPRWKQRGLFLHSTYHRVINHEEEAVSAGGIDIGRDDASCGVSALDKR